VDNVVATDDNLALTGNDSEFEDESDAPTQCCARATEAVTSRGSEWITKHKTPLKWAFSALLCAGYIAYFTYALIYSLNGAIPLIVLTLLAVILLLVYLIWQKLDSGACETLEKIWAAQWMVTRW
jgi:hypothetical protein